jgi:hypothetical protein
MTIHRNYQKSENYVPPTTIQQRTTMHSLPPEITSKILIEVFHDFDGFRYREVRALQKDLAVVPKNINSINETQETTTQCGTLSIHSLPPEIASKILNEFLHDFDRLRCREVCTLWKDLAVVPKNINIRTFGKNAWERYYNYKIESDLPPSPARILEEIQFLHSQLKEESTVPTCTLLLIPQGLTLTLLEKCVHKPHEGKKAKFHENSWKRIFNKDVDIPVKTSYWILILNHVLEGSKGICFSRHSRFVTQKLGGHWQAPSVLEISACAFMNCTSFEKYLFGQNPPTFAMCHEEIDGKKIIAGGFAEKGFFIDCVDTPRSLFGSIAVCRRFL